MTCVSLDSRPTVPMLPSGLCRSVPLLLIVAGVATVGPTQLVAQYPTEPPPPAPLRPVQLPPFSESVLASGLRIVAAENRELPIVSIALAIPVGDAFDPPGKEGLASLTAELLTRGTTTRAAEEISAQIEGVGAQLSSGTARDYLTVSTTVLTEHVDLALDLIADILLHPTFPEAEVELARTRTLSGLRFQESQPGFLADKFFTAELYGDHPYGRTATSASVGAITRDDIVTFAKNIAPDGSVMIFAGDIDLPAARELTDRHLGAWRGTAPALSVAPPPPASPTEIILVNRPGSPQSNVLVGNLTMRPGDPDYYAAVVATKILGGGSDARLFLTLREDKGWTYGAYASQSRPRDIGRLEVSAEVRTEVTDSTVAELLVQLRQMRAELVSTEELTAAKGFLVGSFPRTIETPQQIASEVADVRLLNLGDDYLRQYRERLASITRDQVREAAIRLMHPDSAVIVVVGDGPAIYDKLTAVAPVRIIDEEGNPLQPADLTPTATTLPVDPSRLVARRDSFRVMVQGNPLGTQIAELNADGSGFQFLEVTAIPVVGLTQEVIVTFDPMLQIQTVEKTMQAGPLTGKTRLVFSDGRVQGTAQSPDPQSGSLTTVEIDEAIVEGLVETSAVQPLLASLPLEPGAAFTVMVLESSDGSVKPAKITVESDDDVTVPAGTFSVYRVEISGLETGVVFHVSREDGRIVRMETLGQPIVMELVR